MMQSLITRLAGIAVAVALGGGVASAALVPPATTIGSALIAGGTPVEALFLFADAGDDSDLYVSVNGGPSLFLFSNSNGVTSDQSVLGDLTSFAAGAGQPLVFTLYNRNSGLSFSTGLGSTNVAYISNPSNIGQVNMALGVDIMDAAVVASFNAINTSNLVVIAFEDLLLANSDIDFNDLIFAFVPVAKTAVPVPAALGLFGLGLLGMGAFVRGRRSI